MYNSGMDLPRHREEIAHRLKALEAAIRRLVESLSQGNFPAQIQDATTGSAVRKICAAYSTIDYGMQDEINESLVCPGIIGVNADTIKRAAAVNAAKLNLKDACTPLQGIRVRIPVKGEKSPTKSIPAIRVILRNIQRSDLNLLAAYRKIPILDAPPATVTYTRAVYRKTVEEIAEMLANLNSPAAIADREIVATLDRRVTHLALVKDRYQNIRANVLYARLDPKGRGRIQISAELPLIYAIGARRGRRSESPEVHFPADTDETAKPKRIRQSKLEPEPFLRCLPVYRYDAPA